MAKEIIYLRLLGLFLLALTLGKLGRVKHTRGLVGHVDLRRYPPKIHPKPQRD
jgi:hypothetical protein